MLINQRKLISSSVAACVLGGYGLPALAQQSPGAKAIEEVIVTARKKEESIAEIPLAITVFGSDNIESLGLNNVLDLPAVTPGFSYEKFTAAPGRYDNSPRFRGIAVNSLNPSRQTASVFVDGIFVAGGVQGIAFDDVERIEIIKGPQSAYFGRLTFGGAVNYITKRPSDEFSGKVSVVAAERSDYKVFTSVEGPLIKDLASGKLTASYHDDGGDYKAASSGDELGRERTKSLGGSLFLTPADNLDIKLRAYYYENDDGTPAFAMASFNDHNCAPPEHGLLESTVCGKVPVHKPDLNTQTSAGLKDALNSLYAVNGSNRTNYGLDREALRLSAQFDYDIPDTNMTLSGLFGYNDEEVRILSDIDGSSDEAFVTMGGRSFEDSSFELRLSGLALSDKLNWSVGANYFEQEFINNDEFIGLFLGNFAFSNADPEQEDITTVGVFGSVGYDFTEQLSITVEGRFQRDEIEGNANINDDMPSETVTFESFLPRIILDWNVSDTTLLYASYSEGNLPGGFNGDVALLSPEQLTELRAIQPGVSTAYDEETLSSYELGWKESFADGAGFLAMSAFYMERLDQTFRRADTVTDSSTLTGFRQVNYFVNAGESEVKGLEFETSYNPTDFLQLSGTLAYINSEYKVFESGLLLELVGDSSAAGKKAERFPEWSGSLSAELFGTFSNGLDWFARGDYFYQDKRFADEANLAWAEGGSQINLRIGVSSNNYRVEAFVLNLTDDDTPTAINRFRDLSFATPPLDFSTTAYQVGLRNKRQFGVRASYNF